MNRGGLGVHSPLDRLRKPVSGETGSASSSNRAAEHPAVKAAQWRRSCCPTRSCGPGWPVGHFALGCPAGVLHWSSET